MLLLSRLSTSQDLENVRTLALLELVDTHGSQPSAPQHRQQECVQHSPRSRGLPPRQHPRRGGPALQRLLAALGVAPTATVQRLSGGKPAGAAAIKATDIRGIHPTWGPGFHQEVPAVSFL